MLDSNQIQTILAFPLRDEDARKKLLIGSLVALASLIIPVLPLLVLQGYVVRMMRQVIEENQQPSMPEWTDWNELLMDGLRFFAIRLVVMLPVLLALGFGFVLMFAPFSLIIIDPENADNGVFALFFMLGNLIWVALLMLVLAIVIPLMIVLAAAEGHVTVHRSISAAFRVSEWWPIFRKNMGGFVMAYLIAMGISMLGNIAIQFIMYTFVLICILPFILMPYSVYLQMVMYAFFARAYVEGRDALVGEPSA